MKTAKSSSPVVKIAKYTLLDEVRQKSFVVMFVMCVLFVFLMRGCYHGNYMVNGQVLDAGTVAGTVSKMAFHLITVAVMLITALISIRAFRRDRDEGAQSSILSKPITRRQYVLGKVCGLWVLSSVFMFILHVIVFLMVSVTLKVVVPGYLAASLLCAFNLLFVVIAVLLLSLLIAEVVAFLSIVGVGVVGLVIDGISALSSSQIVHTMAIGANGLNQPDLSLGRILYYVWPKLYGLQHLASSFISGEGAEGFRSIYPLFNILLYCLILGVLLLRRFKTKEIV
jgi:ABC-type transport system involved in multi-copper enzyme maturation permease subunit